MNDASMAAAVRRLANRGGGIVVVDGATVLAELPLPVAGLLSDAPLEEVVEQSHALAAAARELGCTLEEPFQHLAFLALCVIPSSEAHRPGAGRRRPVRARPAGGRRMILGNAWVVTMDDAGTELERGFVRIEDGLVAEVGPGDPPGPARRPARSGADAGLRQHAPPPVPDADARPGPAGGPLHLAANALSGVGPHRRGDGVRRRALRARGAGALGLQHGLRPPLRLPARRLGARRGGAAGRLGARRASRRLARIDGPGRLGRRASAGRARRGHRHDPGRHGAARTASPTARWRRSRSHRARRSRSRPA